MHLLSLVLKWLLYFFINYISCAPHGNVCAAYVTMVTHPAEKGTTSVKLVAPSFPGCWPICEADIRLLLFSLYTSYLIPQHVIFKPNVRIVSARSPHAVCSQFLLR